VSDIIGKSTKPEFSVLPCAEHDDVGMTTRVETLHPMDLAPDFSDGRPEIRFLLIMAEIRVLSFGTTTTVPTEQHRERR